MMIGTGPANASRSEQTFGERNPAGPGSSTSSSFPDSVVHSILSVPVPREGAVLHQEQAQAGGPIWYPDYTTQQCDLLSSDEKCVSGGNTSPLKLTPGFGSTSKGKPNDMGFHPCGFVKFMIACPEDINHYRDLARKSCNRPACPVCWPIWAAREANRAAERIEGHKEAFKRYNTARHVSFSPPPYSVKGLDDLLDRARDVMKIAGVEAAAVIPHPYRLTNTIREAIPDRSWTNRYVEVLGCPTWRDHVRESPHVHGLVTGPLMDAKAFHKRTGWVYVNHDQYAHKRSLRGTLYYLLTHAWVNGNSRVIRYWFGMSTRALGKIELDPVYKTTPCPKCKSDCVRVDVVQDNLTLDYWPAREDLHNCEVFTRKVRRWEYIERLSVKRKG